MGYFGNIVINSQFKPFSYEELIHPLVMQTQTHEAIETGLNDWETKASVWDKLKNNPLDKDVYEKYKRYADSVNSSLDSLNKDGLNAINRKPLLDAKRNYAKEIVPIEEAYTKRLARANFEDQILAKDDSYVFDRRAKDIGLNEFMDNPNLTIKGASISRGKAAVMQELAQLKEKIMEDPDHWKTILGDQYFEKIRRYGISPEMAVDAINNPDKYPQLEGAINRVMDEFGANEFKNEEAKQRFIKGIRGGIYGAVGRDVIDDKVNNNFMDDLKKLQYNTLLRQQSQAAEDEQRRIRGMADPVNLTLEDVYGKQTTKELSDLQSNLLGFVKKNNGAVQFKQYMTVSDFSREELNSIKNGRSTDVRSDHKSMQVSLYKRVGNKYVFKSKKEFLNDIPAKYRAEAEDRYNAITNIANKYNVKLAGNNVAKINDAINNNNNSTGNVGIQALNLNLSNTNKLLKEKILPRLQYGDKELNIHAVNGVTRDSNGNITDLSLGKDRVTLDTFLDKNGKLKGDASIMKVPTKNRHRIIIKFNGRMYDMGTDSYSKALSKQLSVDNSNYNKIVDKLSESNIKKQIEEIKNQPGFDKLPDEMKTDAYLRAIVVKSAQKDMEKWNVQSTISTIGILDQNYTSNTVNVFGNNKLLEE